MTGIIGDSWTYAVSYIELNFENTRLASGSAFFWEQEDHLYLVTNWHNLAGRNPITKKPLSQQCALPDNLNFLEYEQASSINSEGNYSINVQVRNLSLYEEFPYKSLWYEHPTLGSKIDVAVLPIPKETLSQQALTKSAHLLESDSAEPPFVSQDVFIIGYPLGIITGLPVPIWKRATIASEPLIDPENMPKVYVDTATRSGMSGSVAVAQRFHMGPYLKKDGNQSNTLMAVTREILGVYSGRIGDNHLEAQLGIVWKKKVIAEIIEGKKTLECNN